VLKEIRSHRAVIIERALRDFLSLSSYQAFISFQSDRASAIIHSRADTRNQCVQKPRIRRSDELGVTRFGRFIC